MLCRFIVKLTLQAASKDNCEIKMMERYIQLRSYPKIINILFENPLFTHAAYKTAKHLQTIRKISDELWDRIRLIIPPEKPNKTIGCPIVKLLISFARRLLYNYID
jgi:hypothetical protein